MKRLALFVYGGLVSTLILFGCKEGPAGPPGPALTGNLHGRVQVLDYLGNIIQNASGVSVMVGGTGYGAVSDSAGAYAIMSLPTGTYNISFSKAGYATWKINQFQFLGGADYYLSSASPIVMLPVFDPSTFTATVSGLNVVFTGTVLSPSSTSRTIAIYVGRSSPVNGLDASTYIVRTTTTVALGATTFTITLPVTTFTAIGFGSGSTVYATAYSSSTLNPSYFDYVAGRSVYPALGTSPKAASVVLP